MIQKLIQPAGESLFYPKHLELRAVDAFRISQFFI